MKMQHRSRKSFALFFLIIYSVQLFSPVYVFALTSGPKQPEFSGFQAADIAQVVDPFSGDLNYSIPLLEVDGYPLNISYNSNLRMDDEASWVGWGWNLNIGSLDRHVRGVADDMDGSKGDQLVNEERMKLKKRVGGSVTGAVELLGLDIETKSKKTNNDTTIHKPTLTGKISLGVFNDSYTGLGFERGLSVGFDLLKENTTYLTGSLGLQSNSVDGVDIKPSISLPMNSYISFIKAVSGVSFAYNSRSGLNEMTLMLGTRIAGSHSYSHRFNDMPASFFMNRSYKQQYYSGAFNVGATAGTFWAVGVNGYYSATKPEADILVNPLYGSYYAERGKNDPLAIHDFQQGQNTILTDNTPLIPYAIPTPDIYSFTNQLGSGQFKLHNDGGGIYYSPASTDKIENISIGVEIGPGSPMHVGANASVLVGGGSFGKWMDGNFIADSIDFKENQLHADNKYFKLIGENSNLKDEFKHLILGESLLSIDINSHKAQNSYTVHGSDQQKNGINARKLGRSNKVYRSTYIYSLNADEASKWGINKSISSYAINNGVVSNQQLFLSGESKTNINRVDSHRKSHHFSEFNVVTGDGSRYIYDIPVYNVIETDVTYDLGDEVYYGTHTSHDKHLVKMKNGGNAIVGNKGNSEMYYSKVDKPAYATQFLLGAIASADYVDATGDGLTDDDAGTYVKFNYTKLPYLFKWKSPFNLDDNGTAQVLPGGFAHEYDDKASYSYGEREQWYNHSIETKNMIAYFILEDREDAYGVKSAEGGIDTTKPLKRLKEIRLFNKNDQQTPVKTIQFEYSYDLVKGLPNNKNGNGKLTLKKIFFFNRDSDKGKYHPYIFHYNNELTNPANYGYLLTDRWGTYKPVDPTSMKNNIYPYALQDKAMADQNAAVWKLSKVELPSGADIRFDYESDDYSHVQNKKASVMTTDFRFIKDSTGTVAANLWETTGVSFTVNESLSSLGYNASFTKDQLLTWFRNETLGGSEYLYTKTAVNLRGLSNRTFNYFDYVTSYNKVVAVNVDSHSKTFYVQFESLKPSSTAQSVNPILYAALQKMRTELPHLTYPGYDLRLSDSVTGTDIEKILLGITSFFSSLEELLINFVARAKKRNFASQFDLEKSWIRIVKTDGFKLGGGSRVKKVSTYDNWKEMVGGINDYTSSYAGFEYDYTTVDERGRTISSGVASYEPFIGADENTLKQPHKYQRNIVGSFDLLFFVEEPIADMLFPSPSVGYGKVTVHQLTVEGTKDSQQRMGYNVTNFYTAKDFPTYSYKSEIKTNTRYLNLPLVLLTKLIDFRTLSQGILVEINDMHGKVKSKQAFNSKNDLISAEEYVYSTTTNSFNDKIPDTRVTTIDRKGNVHYDVDIATDVESFALMNENKNYTLGGGANFNLNVVTIGPVPVPIPTSFPYVTEQEKGVRYASLIKIVSRSGIIDRVIKTVDGAKLEMKNIAFNNETAAPIVSAQQNEFDNLVYSSSVPASWIYDEMDAKSMSYLSWSFQINTTLKGKITNTQVLNYLKPGDALYDTESDQRLYIVKNFVNGQPSYSLVNDYGNVVSNASKKCVLISPYRKNQLGQNAITVLSSKNPINYTTHKAKFVEQDLSGLNVLNVSATEFENKRLGVEDCNCPEGYSLTNDKLYCYRNIQLNTDYHFSFTHVKPFEETEDDWLMRSIPLNPSSKLAITDVNEAFYLTDSLDIWNVSGPVMGGRPYYLGVGVAKNTSLHLSQEPVEFEICLDIPRNGNYLLVYKTKANLQVVIDQGTPYNFSTNIHEHTNGRYLPMTEGKHRFYVKTDPFPDSPYLYMELIDTPLNKALTMTSIEQENLLFSTGREIEWNVPKLQMYRTIGTTTVAKKDARFDPDAGTFCLNIDIDTLPNAFNPYVSGEYSSFIPVNNYQYNVDRQYQLNAAALSDFSVVQDGYFKTASSLFYIDNNKWKKNESDNRWVVNQKNTIVDIYGNLTESVNILGAYSANIMGYNNRIVTMLAQNARQHEIFTHSFDDISLNNNLYGINTFTNLDNNRIVKNESHSGFRSYRLSGTDLSMTAKVNTLSPETHTEFLYNSRNEFHKSYDSSYSYKGFSPIPAKKYIIQAWVKPTNPYENTIHFNLKMNGSNVAYDKKAIVDKWVLIEGEITTPATGSFSLSFSGNNTYLDDIRIFPKKALAKSYVYDYADYKLLAELDENHMATFYEYDEQGDLIRIKKESEKGILTIQEQRKNVKRK